MQVSDYGQSISVPASRYQILIPFEGDVGLLRHRPSACNAISPVADIDQRNIVINLIGYKIGADDLNREIDTTVSCIKQFLGWQRPQIEACNNQMHETARRKIEERKTRILQSRSIAASLRYPLRA
jgi:hypothetical protein